MQLVMRKLQFDKSRLGTVPAMITDDGKLITQNAAIINRRLIS